MMDRSFNPNLINYSFPNVESCFQHLNNPYYTQENLTQIPVWFVYDFGYLSSKLICSHSRKLTNKSSLNIQRDNLHRDLQPATAVIQKLDKHNEAIVQIIQVNFHVLEYCSIDIDEHLLHQVEQKR